MMRVKLWVGVVIFFLSFSPVSGQVISMEKASLFVQSGESKVKVLFYFIEDCPACQGIVHKLVDLANTYSAEEVAVLGVYVSDEPNLEKLGVFSVDFRLNFPIVEDKEKLFVRKYGATVTPEVVVLDSEGKTRYQGAVDNYYYQLGQHRKNTTKFYMNDAVTAILEAEQVLIPQTTPIGCFINLD